MSPQENRELALKQCSYINDRNWAGFFEHVAHDGTWTVMGRTDLFEYAGEYNKQKAEEMLTEFTRYFSIFSFEVLRSFAENDRVIIEAVAHGEGPGEAEYNNNYVFSIEYKDGKVTALRDFLDAFSVLSYAEQLKAELEKQGS